MPEKQRYRALGTMTGWPTHVRQGEVIMSARETPNFRFFWDTLIKGPLATFPK